MIPLLQNRVCSAHQKVILFWRQNDAIGEGYAVQDDLGAVAVDVVPQDPAAGLRHQLVHPVSQQKVGATM